MAPRVGGRRLALVAVGGAIAGPILLGAGILYGFGALVRPEPDVTSWYVLVLAGAAADAVGLVLALVAARRRRWRGLGILALLVDAALNAGILAVVLFVRFA